MTTVCGPPNASDTPMLLPATTASVPEWASTLPARRTTELLEADTVVGRVAHPGAGRVVSRPGLFELLQLPVRVTVLSAPAGSGKTMLLRSWVGEQGLEDRTAWVR